MSFESKLKRWRIWIRKSGEVYENPTDIKTYNDWLNSGYWYNIKKRYYKKNKKVCSKCGSTKYIHLHHKDYGSMFYGRLNNLTPLCSKCHKKEHKNNKEMPSTYYGKKKKNPYNETKSLRNYIKNNPQGVFTK